MHCPLSYTGVKIFLSFQKYYMTLLLAASRPGLQTILLQSLHLFMYRLTTFPYCAYHDVFHPDWCNLSRTQEVITMLSSLQTVAGEKVEGQGGRRTRTSSVSSTSSRSQKVMMVLFSHLPYSGMGVFRKVTGDSFSRG